MACVIEPADIGFAGDVGVDVGGVAADRFDQGVSAFVLDVGDDDAPALFGEEANGTLADAAGAAP